MTHANDEHAAHDLQLFIENDGDLHRSIVEPVRKNLVTKMARAQYECEKACKAFKHVADQGAKAYHAEHGSIGGPKWHQLFPVSVRRTVAERMERKFRDAARAGEYSHLLPAKYQPKS